MLELFFLLPAHQAGVYIQQKTKPNNKKLFSFQIHLNPNLPRKFFTFSGNLGTQMATGLQPVWIQCCKMFLSFSFSYILFSWRIQKSITDAEAIWDAIYCFCAVRTTHLGLSEAYPEENGKNVFPFPIHMLIPVYS